MLQWIRKHRKELAGISDGEGAFLETISFNTNKVIDDDDTKE